MGKLFRSSATEETILVFVTAILIDPREIGCIKGIANCAPALGMDSIRAAVRSAALVPRAPAVTAWAMTDSLLSLLQCAGM